MSWKTVGDILKYISWYNLITLNKINSYFKKLKDIIALKIVIEMRH